MATEEYQEEDAFCFNVGGWFFSVPKSKLSQFQDSVLWQEASSLALSEEARLFIDRDGYTFRHVHYYLHTSKLSFSCFSEIRLLYEQATAMCLTSLQQALDNMKEGRHHLRIRPADVPITKRASRNYWRTRCNSKPSEFQIKSPAFTGLHDKAPLGLIDTPLLDTEEVVQWYFLSLDLVKKYPTLINDDNLLWLCEGVVLIEIGWSHFRFIANFLQTGKLLVPKKFSELDALVNEAEILQLPELVKAVKSYRVDVGYCNPVCNTPEKPLYVLVLELLVKYPDSALGQLCIESSLNGMKLYIFGNGVLFKHVRSWLGTCRLPLTEDVSQMGAVCVYLDRHDCLYRPVKDAMRLYLQKRKSETLGPGFTMGAVEDSWTPEVDIHTLHQIVKVYVGNYWYATYLKTFLKYPELLANPNKAQWIAYGKTLFISGDGQMFRHIINFLRLDKLYIPSGFKEWPLLCQEIEECKIPALSEAMRQCESYRMWCGENDAESVASISSVESSAGFEEEENVLDRLVQKKRNDIMIGTNKSSTLEMKPRVWDQFDPSGNTVQCLVNPTVKSELIGQTEANQEKLSLANFPVTTPTAEDSAKQGLLGADGCLQCNFISTSIWNGKEFDESMECNNFDAWPLSAGFILNVHHPLLLGNDGSSVFYTDADAHCNNHSARSQLTDLASLTFNLSHEEIFYARECHHFLTGIILDSYTLKDPQKITWEILHLVNILWTKQIPPEKFVTKLLNMKAFRNQKQAHEKLVKWVKLTLPFAQKYSQCMEILLKKGYYKSVSFSMIGN
eukprot:gi/632978237/ref/XP_007905795.1/ PREDICTED: BTB/POZ domain-containing protein KCTD19 [Callorhinchus milii]